MAISKIDICNQALSLVGAQNVVALTDKTREAQQCTLWYDQILRTVLVAHPWNFATSREALARVDPAARGEAYSFRYPVNCIKILWVGEEGGTRRADYQVRFTPDGQVVSAQSPAVDAVYIRMVTDTNSFSPGFIECLGLRLAVELAGSLSADKQMQGMMFQRYSEALLRARTQDAQEFWHAKDRDGGGYVEVRSV